MSEQDPKTAKQSEVKTDHTDWSESTASHHKSSLGKMFAIVFLCFVSSFLGAWVFLSTGLVKVDNNQTITNNREKIVSQEGEIMADVAKKVSPSVVSVTTQSITGSGVRGVVSEGAGTGIIISRDGYIVTNKHVIGDARNISVVTNDDTTYKDVELVGTDPLNDLAFLKIKGASDLTPAKLADSGEVQIGQKVVAIGNALGQYQNSVTSGIISGQGRPVVAQDGDNNEQLDNLFQTDTAINPGNSGGPLLNLSGEVIGINTAIAENAQGIGFAIPINAAKGLIKNLLATGKVQRAYLGVRYVTITPETAGGLKVSTKQGAYVYDSKDDNAAVMSGSPADKAGIKNKDIITKVNDTPVTENNGLALLLSQFAPGDTVNLTIVSGNTTKTVEVTLSEYRG